MTVLRWFSGFRLEQIWPVVRSLSVKYRPDRYRHEKSVKFGTELS